MQESTVTIKGQTTLPKDVRAALQLHPGDRVRYMILDGGEVRLVRSRPVTQLAGLLKSRTDRQASLDDIDEAIAKGAVGK
ncbi:AbrB/MazE/SpoVT family DNA-binding domain-containing protein [Pseudotabrizicola alkalilacus]|uniref:AbrB family transcriptional regulator n=1 Tax=Pseudotabrizicola alkalilacus TaxID=2305252 RepID=A0A411YWV2_9RHOB|nr:type II toxin-antitoxin system PrlF family antitoxin [Pseudotabrizicola alkalilacus]RGP35282.1 AbrB family transcriptional regulator [Pseudotabrizicola alkalilacus]